jgi:transposase
MNNSLFLNQIEQAFPFSQFPIIVSLDTHARSTFIYAVNVVTGEILYEKNILGTFKKVFKHFVKIGDKSKMQVIYEAGSLGFFPFRVLTKKGYSCQIIAPSSLPKNSKKKKTDKIDSKKNLQYHASGILKYVVPPNEEDETNRDLLRYRTDSVDNVTKQKQKIYSLTVKYGLFNTVTKTNWTKKHREWLKTVKLKPAIRLILNIMLDELAILEDSLKKVDCNLDILFQENQRYKSLYGYYSLLPGFGRVCTMTMILEGGDLNRFKHPVRCADFVGLMPGKHASGTSDPALAITKEGNKHLRRITICAAKAYGDRRKVYNNSQLERLNPELKPFIEKLQNRLCFRYQHLRSRQKHSNKIRCAIARELIMFIWEYSVKIIPTLKSSGLWQKAA